jgi:hypothetical protein
MKQIKILIEKTEDRLLKPDEIKYTFRTLMNIAGLSSHFIRDPIDCRIDIYYGKTCFHDCQLFIERMDTKRNNVRLPIGTCMENNFYFLLFDNRQRRENIISKKGTSTYVWNDIIFASFYLLSGWQERFIHRDIRGRPMTEESFLYQERLLHYPIVNQYAKIVKDTFATSHKSMPLWPSKKEYAVALTHDVDYPEMVKWIEAVRYLIKYKHQSSISRTLDILTGKESFWRFEEWTELEQGYGMKSAFYFCGFKGSLLRYMFKAPDPFYDIRQDSFRRIMKYLVRNGFEVGMHSSYLAYESTLRLITEKTAIEQVLGESVLGNRHHYWHVSPNNPSETAVIHDRAGLLYDSSIAFAHRTGFRYGICSPFHLYDPVNDQPVSTLELPPALMDAHLFQYAKYSYFEHYESEIDALLDSTKKYGGIFIANYHARSLNETFYPGWRQSYEYLLDKITEKNDYYCDTPINITNYWLSRERKIQEESIDEDRSAE